MGTMGTVYGPCSVQILVRDDEGLAMAIDDALDYLTGLFPVFHSALVVITDAYQARLAKLRLNTCVS